MQFKSLCLSLVLSTISFLNFAQLATDSLPDKARPKIGLVLSGGGAKGFAHVGVLKIIDELGIPIDYIAGTSMGGLIGGFYAIGYSAVDIEKIILSQNWENLLSDNVSRKFVPIYEKKDFERYILSFPIKPKGIQLPSGIVGGQNVINLFERLTIEYHDQMDFNKLPIPFLCIATDLETGKAVVLDKGYLPLAMRASMAIPTFFSPVEIDGKLLADGGMINNFPVKELINMGADIIIGVDVQSGVKSKKELKSILDIMNQTVSLMALNNFKDNLKYCDIYIKPKIDEYTVGSFQDADSLIHRGEAIAQTFIPTLLDLKKKYNLEKKKLKAYVPPCDSSTYFIKDVEVNGLNEVSYSLLYGKLNLEMNSNVSLYKLQDGINRVYGSRYFDRVDFQMKGEEEKTLIVNVKERTTKRFNVGLHYDSDNNAAVLLNTTFRNKLKSGSRLSFDLKLSESPRFKTTYTIDNGLRPGFNIEAEYNDSEVYAFKEGKKIASYDFNYMKFNFNVHSIFRESYSFGLGGKLEYYNINSEFRTLDLLDTRDEDYYFTYYAFLNLDSHDKAYYPKTGMSLYGEYKLVTNNGFNLDGMNRPASVAYLKFQKAISVSSAFTVYPKFYGRVVWGKNIPNFYMSYTGGIDQTDYFDIQMPFVGLERMEMASVNSFVFRADFQYELFRNNYLILKTNAGKLVEDVNNTLTQGEWIRGIGLTYSYNSLIGPIEFSLMYSDKKNGISNYVNLGFWF
ncbi:patatin-like phospholipase family protein [Labilibaculum sp. K2S]|uniref:patatin-like phospholipase family protein n=1 Tax=Labilibaculum sp. K2S TaxID=3056386 RepID=UPI0025A34C63|nr:patatin-like phospholipase family protein [Labilibaculum sp. K2S]MDM8159689.1 patatin-like phospholipase family protein [Labilibaculum sp. K2S]